MLFYANSLNKKRLSRFMRQYQSCSGHERFFNRFNVKRGADFEQLFSVGETSIYLISSIIQQLIAALDTRQV
jgi:hypothetical protein